MAHTFFRFFLTAAVVLGFVGVVWQSSTPAAAADQAVYNNGYFDDDDPPPLPAPDPGQQSYAPQAYAGHTYAQQRPDLFYNYYVQGQGGGVPAAMYVAPRPVPMTVGHVYYTYQPMYPHEHLHYHYRRYVAKDSCNRTTNRTSVTWTGGHVRSTHLRIFNRN